MLVFGLAVLGDGKAAAVVLDGQIRRIFDCGFKLPLWPL